MRPLKSSQKDKAVLMSAVGCALALALAACTSTAAAPTAAPAAPTIAPAQPTATPAVKPTTAPAAAVSPSPAASVASPVASPATGPAVVKVTQNPSVGAILTDGAGRTLYMFANDKDKASNCYDQCERNWPPLLTRGQPQASNGAEASKLSTTTRRDGSMQVVYDEYPLYYYTPDTGPGDTKGHRVGNVWFVLGSDGEPMK